jgi:hypothetical protein
MFCGYRMEIENQKLNKIKWKFMIIGSFMCIIIFAILIYFLIQLLKEGDDENIIILIIFIIFVLCYLTFPINFIYYYYLAM